MSSNIRPFGRALPPRFGRRRVILGFTRTEVDADNTSYTSEYTVHTLRVRDDDEAFATIGQWFEENGC